MQFINNITLDVMGKALLLVLAVVFLIGVFLLITGIIPSPSGKTRKTVRNYRNAGKSKKAQSNGVDESFKAVTKKFAKNIHLTAIEKAEMEKALLITGSQMTPEEFTAFIRVKAGLFIGAGLIVFIFGFLAQPLMTRLGVTIISTMPFTLAKILGIGFAAIGLFSYIKDKRGLKKEHKNAIASVEGELPRFVSYLKIALETSNAGVLALLENYRSYDEHFAYELSQTIADAKTSNFDSAMARWDQRFNSERLKMVIHGLVAANNGDDVRLYFNMLERDFTSFEISLLKANVKSIPERMRIPKMLMYTSVFLTLFFPIIMQVIDSFKQVFMS